MKTAVRSVGAFVALSLFLFSCSGGGPTGPTIDLEDKVIVAFGNSITAGVGDTNYPRSPSGYPIRLQQLLQVDYSHVAVVNRGVPGETTTTGVRRLATILSIDQPDYVLLLQGTNDIRDGGTSWVSDIIQNLTSMVAMVKAAGATPLIASLTPAIGDHLYKAASISLVNPQIQALARSQDIPFVDLYAELNSQPDVTTLLDSDGLHPNASGYQIIASAWYNALLVSFE